MDQISKVNAITPKNILIVDDDPVLCQLLDMLFSSEGYRTTFVCSGEEAVDRVRQGRTDFVILDVKMPGMDGWQTYEHVRQLSNIPVLFLTALALGEGAARALISGGNDYVRKPFHPEELVAHVETTLRNWGMAHPDIGINGDSTFIQDVYNPKDLINDEYKRIQGRVVAVIPAYNEERLIGSVVLRARKYAATVIVVDDGSTDKTEEVARAAGANIVKHENNKGYGAAIATAFCTARQLEVDAIILIDGDGQHDPDQIPALVEPILAGRADMVVGSRYLEKKSDVPFFVQKAHDFITGMTNMGSGTRLSDSQCGFRAFSWRAIREAQLCANGMTAASEFQFLANQLKWKVEEVPVTILYDKKEPKKRSLIKHGLVVVNGIFHLIGQTRPLLFFGVPGMAMILTGLIWGLRVVNLFNKNQVLPVGTALISILLLILGILGLFTAIILNTLRVWFIDFADRRSPNNL